MRVSHGRNKYRFINSKQLLKGLVIVFAMAMSLVTAEQYQGLVWANIVEANGDVYRGYEGFESSGVFDDKQVIYFSQERGQKVALVGNKILFDSSGQHKYHLVVDVTKREGERFWAELKVYLNTMVYDESIKDYVVRASLIDSTEVDGTLNSKNDFLIIEENLPNINVSLDFDRVFERQEIEQRLVERLESTSK